MEVQFLYQYQSQMKIFCSILFLLNLQCCQLRHIFPFGHFLNANKPPSGSMFEYNPSTSILHKKVLLGIFAKERKFLGTH